MNQNRISQLREVLQSQGVDGFILPVNDEYMGEYIPSSAKRLKWLTGFTGSAGAAVVLKDKAAFFTDGRYTLQAETQVKDLERHNSADCSLDEWLAVSAPGGSVIGYDPRLHTLRQVKAWERKEVALKFKALAQNPIDGLWKERPAAPASPVQVHPLHFSGETSLSKRQRMAKQLKQQGVDVAVLTAPDSIMWLLNIRGNDVPYTPFILCYALLYASGEVTLFLDAARLNEETQKYLAAEAKLVAPSAMEAELATLKAKKVMYDPGLSPIWFHNQLTSGGATIVEGSDPCQPAKACKNPIEVEGMQNSHLRDGLAVTRFLHWLDGAVKNNEKLSECSVADKLLAFRREHGLFREPSFSTIAGSGPNGAIVHYQAKPGSDRALDYDSLLLLDSGGQYPDGTTDITRTLAIGSPNKEMCECFTRVLKGHIALAMAVFPEGTTGAQLDVLARNPLWQAGLDYDHGTGHGVGSYLSVHEGPQRISKRGGDISLKPGMVLSNEPGYYKTGAFGIRIENLVLVKEYGERENRRFLSFETLTMVPIDMRIVVDAMLSAEEREWLRNYHKQIYKAHAPSLSTEELHWLARYCGQAA